MSDKDEGFMMIGVPDETYELVRKVAKKTGTSAAQAMSDALKSYAKSTLSAEEIDSQLKEDRQLLCD
jgi:hypothetical protein